MYRKYIKRLLDILIGSGVLIFLSPVLLITAVLIKLESPGPVIFKQQRIGYKTKVFIVVKKLFVEVPKFEQQMAV